MDAMECIQTRHSCRKFSNRRVDRSNELMAVVVLGYCENEKEKLHIKHKPINNFIIDKAGDIA